MSNIYVEDVGKGFPFVFVHGYLGSSEMWNFQKEFFSKHYRVIIPALPGFGESHNVKSLDSINKMARQIIDLLDQYLIFRLRLQYYNSRLSYPSLIQKILRQHDP